MGVYTREFFFLCVSGPVWVVELHVNEWKEERNKFLPFEFQCD